MIIIAIMHIFPLRKHASRDSNPSLTTSSHGHRTQGDLYAQRMLRNQPQLHPRVLTYAALACTAAANPDCLSVSINPAPCLTPSNR